MVEVDLFQIGLDHVARLVFDVDIVFVRGIAAPVAAGCVNFDQHDAMHRRAGRQQVVDLAADVVAPADADRHVLRPDQPGLVVLVGGHPRYRELAALLRRDCQLGPARQVERVPAAAEHIRSPANPFPCSAAAFDPVAPAHIDERELVLARVKRPDAARIQPPRLERDELPSGALRRNFQNQPLVICVILRADQNAFSRISHSHLLSQGRPSVDYPIRRAHHLFAFANRA